MSESKIRISMSDTDNGFTTIPLNPRVRSRRIKAPLISSSMKACKLNYQGSKGSVKILDIKVPLKRRVHFTDPPYYTRGHRDSDELPNFVMNSDIKCLQVPDNKETYNGRISLQGSLVSQHDEREQQFCDKFTKDKKFRAKFLHTLCIYMAFWVLGWTIGQFGPSFLDLQVITGTTLEQGSAFMTSHSIGYLLGSLTLGLMFDRLDKILLVLFPLVGIGVTLAIIPWCAIYGLMIVIHLLKGLFNGGLDAVSNAETVYIWGDKGRSYMQALHFCFAMGGILSPLATAPFLVPIQQSNGVSITNEKIRDLLDNKIQSQNTSFLSNTGEYNSVIPFYRDEENVTTSFLYAKYQNQTFFDYKENVTTWFPTLNSTLVKYINTNNSVGKSRASKPEAGSTSSKLYIAYTTTSALALLAAIPFLVMYIKGRKTEMAECRTDEEKLMKILPLKMKVIILINMSLLLGTYSAIEDTFAGFLTTFCVRQLDWTKAAGSFATSVYWASFGSGRFVGIFLVKFCSPVRIITLYCILLIISFCGMYFSAAGYFDAGIWICSILGGFALSVIFPTVFTWTEAELLPVTGKIASMFLIASSSGTMVNPIVLGFLMDQLTPIWFCYLMLGESITLFFLFLSALNLSRKVQEAKENTLETDEYIEKPEVVSEDEFGTEEENENLLREYEKINAMTFLCFRDDDK